MAPKRMCLPHIGPRLQVELEAQRLYSSTYICVGALLDNVASHSASTTSWIVDVSTTRNAPHSCPAPRLSLQRVLLVANSKRYQADIMEVIALAAWLMSSGAQVIKKIQCPPGPRTKLLSTAPRICWQACEVADHFHRLHIPVTHAGVT